MGKMYKLVSKKDISDVVFGVAMDIGSNIYVTVDLNGKEIGVDSPSYREAKDQIADLELIASLCGLSKKQYTIKQI
jgi:hypothetical protein